MVITWTLPTLVRAQGEALLTVNVYYDNNANGQQDAGEAIAEFANIGMVTESGQVVPQIGPRVGPRGEYIYTLPVPRESLFVFAYMVPGSVALPLFRLPMLYGWGRTVDMSGKSEASVSIGIIKREKIPRYEITGGGFFTQTNGIFPELPWGYAVTNADGIPFWDTWQRFGLQNVGYPASHRFVWKGFVTQVMQKAVLQWQPGKGVFFINVFDELHDAGKDPWLLAFRSTPVQLDPSFDAGKSWDQIVRDRLALLDDNPAIKAKYYEVSEKIDPMLLYGLPTSRVTDMSNHWAIRLQRAVIQHWKVDVPWAKAEEVTIANGGDIAKEAGLFPADALVPQLPP